MGSYDHVHDGTRCGQVKCWGKSFGDITPGDAVVLHRQVDPGEFAALLGGSSVPEGDLAVAGRPVVEIVDYQVPCSDGSLMVVHEGIFVGFATDRDDALPVCGNDGRPFDGHGTAHVGPAADCEVCRLLR